MLLQHVVPLFGAPYGHLRAKACWLAGIYADIEFQDGQGKPQPAHPCPRILACWGWVIPKEATGLAMTSWLLLLPLRFPLLLPWAVGSVGGALWRC